MLVSAVDYNLQSVDIKAVFLLAEATISMLKKIITKLVSRSKFKHELRSRAVYDLYEKNTITDKKILDIHHKRLNSNQFELDAQLINTLKSDLDHSQEADKEGELSYQAKESEPIFDLRTNQEAKNKEWESLVNPLSNSMNVPVRKLPITLFDLKNLLQVNLITY